MNKTIVMIIDEEVFFRAGVRQLLTQQPEYITYVLRAF